MCLKISSIVLVFLGLTACVSPKIYNDLESKYNALKNEQNKLSNDKDLLQKENDNYQNEFISLKEKYAIAVNERDKYQNDYTILKSKFDKISSSYEVLEQNSSKSIAANTQKNRELLAQLESKEQALIAESQRLSKLKGELEKRSNQVAELEQVIAEKEATMTALKNSVSAALTSFEGKGLTVSQHEGKVYVSMENKLLFHSGSWSVGSEGRDAVQQLGSVLAKNPSISVLIEGHTDNVPYAGNEKITNNWDLSTKRATAIVNILDENEDINPANLTAAGRGEFNPIAPNYTPEGRAKNRRIEIILTPKLDEISKLLNSY